MSPGGGARSFLTWPLCTAASKPYPFQQTEVIPRILAVVQPQKCGSFSSCSALLWASFKLQNTLLGPRVLCYALGLFCLFFKLLFLGFLSFLFFFCSAFFGVSWKSLLWHLTSCFESLGNVDFSCMMPVKRRTNMKTILCFNLIEFHFIILGEALKIKMQWWMLEWLSYSRHSIHICRMWECFVNFEMPVKS